MKLDRIKEPSTMAGIGLLGFAADSMLVDPSTLETVQQVANAALPVLINPTPVGILTGLLGVLSIFMGEKGGAR